MCSSDLEARLCAVVSVAAVSGIQGLAPRPRVASADTMTIAARMAATVTRWLSHAIGNRVAVHGCGWSITGDLTAVYADHLEISSAGGCTAVPLHALDVVFVASG